MSPKEFFDKVSRMRKGVGRSHCNNMENRKVS